MESEDEKQKKPIAKFDESGTKYDLPAFSAMEKPEEHQVKPEKDQEKSITNIDTSVAKHDLPTIIISNDDPPTEIISKGELPTTEKDEEKSKKLSVRPSKRLTHFWGSDENIYRSKKEKSHKPRRNTLDFVRYLAKELRFRQSSQRGDDTGANDTTQIKTKKGRGLTENMAATFLIGTAMGGFVFELPYALRDSGFLGVFMIILSGVNSLYSGMLLGWCWTMMEERWPEYRAYYQSPYAEIGYRVGGKWLKYFVGVIVVLNQLGIGILLLRLMAKFIHRTSDESLSFCPWLLICPLILIPLTFFRTPKDFRFLGVVSLLTSFLAILLLSAAVISDKSRVQTSSYEQSKLENFMISFGVMILAFNAGAIYPTIQIDMYDRKSFPNSVFTAFLVILLMSVTFPVLAYAVYGDETAIDIQENIYQNKELRGVGRGAEIVLIFQIASSTILQINPVFQSIEGFLNDPISFTYKRCLVRIGLIALILIASVGAKHLVPYMLYGIPVTVNLLTYIIPCVFYIVLVYKTGEKRKERKITKKEWVFLVELFIIGVLGIAASYILSYHQLVQQKRFNVDCFDPKQFNSYTINQTKFLHMTNNTSEKNMNFFSYF